MTTTKPSSMNSVTSFIPSDNLLSSLDQFVRHLYGQESAEDVNEARYNMFRLGLHAEKSLPPNKDALINPILRANRQPYFAVVVNNTRRCLALLVYDEDGDSMLEVDWCNLPPAPEHILELDKLYLQKCKCKLTPSTGETV